MLDEDELREMAASIAERGQYVPCRMTPDGLGLDGRNRVAACALAEIEPRWEVYDGDPIPFIVEVNAERRHLTTGQRAMATAIGLVEAGQRRNGRFERGSVPDQTGGSAISEWKRRVSEAGLVLDHASKLADPVLRGDLALDAAHKEAATSRDRTARIAELDEQLAALVRADVISLDDAEQRVRDEARIAALPEDLAARVQGGGLALSEAEVIATERDQRIAAWAQEISGALGVLLPMAGSPVPDDLADKLKPDERAALRTLLVAYKKEARS